MDRAHARVAAPLARRAADMADRRRLRADGRNGHRHRAHRRPLPAECNRERPRQPGERGPRCSPAISTASSRTSRCCRRASSPSSKATASTSADVFRSEMGTLAVHEVLRAKASGWSDVAGANVFDANGVLINSSRRWPVADISVADRGYFNRLKNDPASQEEVEVVPGRFGSGPAIVFARRVSGPHGEFLGHGLAGDRAGPARILLRLERARRGILDRDAPPERPVARARSACRRDDRTEFPQRHARADGGVRAHLRHDAARKPDRRQGSHRRRAPPDRRAAGRGRDQVAGCDAGDMAHADEILRDRRRAVDRPARAHALF